MHESAPLLIENSPNKCYNFIFIIAPAASGRFYEKRCLSMSKAQNEIEEFIYKICYRPIWGSVNSYIATHIRIDEDSLFFDSSLSCTIELQQFDEYRGDMSRETSQWLIASCEAVITDKLESLTVSSVMPWSKYTKTVFYRCCRLQEHCSHHIP